ncbi:MAG TPA: MarR family transcriptional regulator, partial [Pseudorhodoferax sp.]|nr:MarR family transcriptional regulator [Pseudorhodoferax sp.]
MAMTKSADLREQFGLRLGKIARLWRARIDQHLEPFGLTEARWRTLLYLSHARRDVRQTDLAFALGVRGPTLVRVLDRLESESLIERRSTKDDLRVKTVHLGLGAKPVLKQIKKVAEEV